MAAREVPAKGGAPAYPVKTEMHARVNCSWRGACVRVPCAPRHVAPRRAYVISMGEGGVPEVIALAR